MARRYAVSLDCTGGLIELPQQSVDGRSVLNNRAEHDHPVATLSDLGRPVIVSFEPTGNYHRVLAHRLMFRMVLAEGRSLLPLKFCGLDLATHQSGTFLGQTKLCKFGNSRLRRSFWLAAQAAIRQRDNSLREHYGRYVAKDPENKHLRRKALITVAAKMARVALAIARSRADYRPFFEQPVPSGRTSLLVP